MNKFANPWKEISLPPELTNMRSMLSEDEEQYLVWLTAVKSEGWGAIVDLGPWLGSSSAALAGAEEADRRTKSEADLFKWERSIWGSSRGRSPGRGKTFFLFMREIGNYAWISPEQDDRPLGGRRHRDSVCGRQNHGNLLMRFSRGSVTVGSIARASFFRISAGPPPIG